MFFFSYSRQIIQVLAHYILLFTSKTAFGSAYESASSGKRNEKRKKELKNQRFPSAYLLQKHRVTPRLPFLPKGIAASKKNKRNRPEA